MNVAQMLLVKFAIMIGIVFLSRRIFNTKNA